MYFKRKAYDKLIDWKSNYADNYAVLLEGARRVGYCIADSLGDAYLGRLQTGLFFSGANGYKVKELVHVKDLIEELLTPLA